MSKRIIITLVLIGTYIYYLVCAPNQTLVERCVLGLAVLLCVINQIYEHGLNCRKYHIGNEGVTAIWYRRIQKKYKWSDFSALEMCRIVDWHTDEVQMICATKPIKKREDGCVDGGWIVRHPLTVLCFYISSPEEREYFFRCSQRADD